MRPSVVAVALASFFLAPAATAAPIVLEGEVPSTGGDFFYVPFTVPPGTVEIEVKHDDLSKENILDFGVDDQKGWRGWGGGNEEPAVIGVDAASRSYLPGPIAAGEWKVVIGKAKIKVAPAKYRLEIELRTAPTLPKVARTPYKPAVVEGAARWYAGDFHVHSRESGDARPTLDEIAVFAKSRGLDFVELSDHNTVSQVDLINEAQAKNKFLFIPGIEYTTYKGHGNAIGATQWVNHRIGDMGATITDSIKEIRAQNALFSINHPALDLGDQCIGCAWLHDVPGALIDAVEIETLGYKPLGFLFHNQAMQFWERLLATGAHIAPIGGSDDHKAGKELDNTQSAIGSPTTMVFARELSAAGILEGIKLGKTVVKLQGPADPMIELTTDVAPTGDTVNDEFVVLRAKIVGTGGETIRFVKNGTPLDEVDITGDGFVYQKLFDAPASGEDRYRAEVLIEGKARTITSHVFVKRAVTGRPRPVLSAPAEEDKGCGCGFGAGPRASIVVIAMGAIALLFRRRFR